MCYGLLFHEKNCVLTIKPWKSLGILGTRCPFNPSCVTNDNSIFYSCAHVLINKSPAIIETKWIFQDSIYVPVHERMNDSGRLKIENQTKREVPATLKCR